MKVHIFSYVFWPEYFLVNELSEALAERGHDVSVQTSLPNYQTGSFAPGYGCVKGPYFEKQGCIKIYRYPVVPRKKTFIFLALNYVSNVLFGCINLFRLPKADVYFFFATSPLLFILPVVFFKKITRKPLVIWYQDLWPDSFFAVTRINPKSIFGKILDPLIRFIYRNTDLMLVQSPAFLDNLKKYDYKGPMDVLYNWAPSFKPLSSEPEWLRTLPKNKFILTFAGNIGKAQALDHVIEAAKQLQSEAPQVHIAMVGEGSFLPVLQKRVQELNLFNVQFYGRKPVDDMPALFVRSDALLVSLKDDPTFNRVVPSKIQAYMTAEKPIVAFLNGVGAEVVAQAQCGVVISAENREAFVKRVKALQALPVEERKAMGQRGLQFFKQNFEKKAALDKLEKYLIETVNRS